MEKSTDGVPLGADGCKLDAGKAPVYSGVLAYFPRALAAVAEVSAAGIRKGYAPMSWRGVQDGVQRYSDALARHLLRENTHDKDDGPGGTGLPHMALAAWNALARLELMLLEQEDGET